MRNRRGSRILRLRSEKYKGMEVEVKRNEVHSAERQLGVRLSMDGNDNEEYVFRLEQSKALAGKVLASPFKRKDAEIMYRERWLASVGYCLPITQFTLKQSKAIQSPFFNAILPKMGFNRHFPRDVILGPAKYQGKQLDDYATFQYTSHLMRFVGYVRQGKAMGNMLRVQMDQYQQIIGTEKHFLTLPSNRYSYGERSRIQFLWEQNTMHGVTLLVQGAWTQKIARTNDVFIMDKLSETPRSVGIMDKLNNVRLWLQISRLSDMVNEAGDNIERWALYGPPKKSELDWTIRFPNFLG